MQVSAAGSQRTGRRHNRPGGRAVGQEETAEAAGDLLSIDTDVGGMHIVLFDDICTTGYQLDSIAGRLLDAAVSGAS